MNSQAVRGGSQAGTSPAATAQCDQREEGGCLGRGAVPASGHAHPAAGVITGTLF